MVSAHALAEARSLAYHRVVAERLCDQPELIALARRRVQAWLAESNRAAYYLNAWAELLRLPVPELAERLCEDSEWARAMRQATPFAGVLSPRERWTLWKDVRATFTPRERSGT